MPGNRRKVDVNKALELISQGNKLAYIAGLFDCSHVAVIQALQKAGLPTSAKKYRLAKEAGTLPAGAA